MTQEFEHRGVLDHVQTLAVRCNVRRLIVEWVLLFKWNADLINHVFY